jgi:glycosyltransferase involved in cell wall biosynthesis
MTKKVLVFGMTENPGGVESVIMNYYRNIDLNKIHFDFLCNSYEPIAYEDELTSNGSKCFHFVARSKNPIKYHKELKTFFKKHADEYSAIWVNVCSLANIDYLKLAKKYGISKRIIHSHNSENMDSKLRGKLHEYNKKNLWKYATDFWACSEEAAKWFYDEKLLKKVVIIKNAIDINRVSFDEKKRQLYREKINAKDRFVIGNVGRLHFQKNQSFLIDIFNDYLKEDPTAICILIGDGEDKHKLINKVKRYGIEDRVLFLGVQSDMQGWLSAMDLFLFPSLFEGLPVAPLEAQANGVPVLAAEGVMPEAVQINNNFYFIELDCSAVKWARKISSMKKNVDRLELSEIKANFSKSGYDIDVEAKKIEKIF